jgi:quinol monooxygenase YgiN
MAAVRVIARAQAREGKAEELKKLLRRMVAPTRAEKGCEFYELFESNHPGLFFFNELWASQADLDAHASSSHFRDVFGGAANELMQVPFEVNLLTEVV